MSDKLYALYGKPVHTVGGYAVFVCMPVNIDINSTAYAVFNMDTEVREAEFTNLAHAIAGCSALEESLREVLDKENAPSGFDGLETPPNVLQ
jgi:hypothetical protein